MSKKEYTEEEIREVVINGPILKFSRVEASEEDLKIRITKNYYKKD